MVETAVTLQDAFEFTPRGLVVHGAPSIDEWLRRVGELRDAQDALLWCLGDMLNYGEARYGEKYAQVAEETGYDPDYLRNVAYVARQFDLSLRSDKLRWSHHRALAAQWIKPEDRARIIAEAEQKRLTVDEIRARVRMLPYAPVLPARTRHAVAEPRVVDLPGREVADGRVTVQGCPAQATPGAAVTPPHAPVIVCDTDIESTLTGVFARRHMNDDDEGDRLLPPGSALTSTLVGQHVEGGDGDGRLLGPASAPPLPPPSLLPLRATVEACYGRQVVLVFDEAPDLRDGQRIAVYIESKEAERDRSSDGRKARPQ